MENFTTIDLLVANLEQQQELRNSMTENPPWDTQDRTKQAVSRRRELSAADFWYFDKTYFPPSVYSDGFSKPAKYHKELIATWDKPGVDVFLGPRKHAKTATWKKFYTWLLLTGRVEFAATMSDVLTKSANMLRDIARFVTDERVMYDFKPDIIEHNSEQLTIRVRTNTKNRMVQATALSEKRSAKGASFGLSRPSLILCDDIETRRSPLGSEHVEHRLHVLQEARSSMSQNGKLIVLGNNFDERCCLNQLKQAKEQGLLPDDWNVYTHRAWDGKRPLWKERFPAKSESECKKLCGAADEGEWQGDFQQNPVPPDGFIFSREKLQWYNQLPNDARGVLYCDPNLAKKAKGDSTAVTVLLYSPVEDRYYIDGLLCKSFSSPHRLLESVFEMYSNRCRALGFDGNVSQESTWTNFVRDYSRITGRPCPHIEYCHYSVDELAKNTQSAWSEAKFYFNARLQGLTDTDTYLRQLFSFAGKKANRADDAPDSLICAFELLARRHLGRKNRAAVKPIIINDYYL